MIKTGSPMANRTISDTLLEKDWKMNCEEVYLMVKKFAIIHGKEDESYRRIADSETKLTWESPNGEVVMNLYKNTNVDQTAKDLGESRGCLEILANEETKFYYEDYLDKSYARGSDYEAHLPAELGPHVTWLREMHAFEAKKNESVCDKEAAAVAV